MVGCAVNLTTKKKYYVDASCIQLLSDVTLIFEHMRDALDGNAFIEAITHF